MNILVRPLDEDDVSQAKEYIVRLKLLNEEIDPNFKAVDDLKDVARGYILASIEDENVAMYVCEDLDTNQIIGLIRIEFKDRMFYHPRKEAVITDIYVKAGYRGKNVGKVLVEKAIASAKERGAGLLVVSYPVNNTIADKFFTDMGFKDLRKERFLNI